MGGIAIRLLALCAIVVPFAAQAQERYAGPRNIYSFEVPAGWTRAGNDSQADVVFAAPEGFEVGKLYAGLSKTQAPLAEEMGEFAGREAQTLPIELGGIPCLGATVGGLNAVQNYLMCQLWITLPSGSEFVTFFLGSSSRPDVAAEHQRLFLRVARSIDFGASLAP